MQGNTDLEKSNIYDITKDSDSTPVMDFKEMEIYDLPNKEIKIIVFKKLNENGKEQTARQKQENNSWQNVFNKEIESIKKNQTEILEFKKTMPEIKNSKQSFNNSLNHTKELANSKTIQLKLVT